MLITNTKSKLIAAQAGFLLAEIDTLSAQHLPVDYAATGELITAHLTKLVHCSNDRKWCLFFTVVLKLMKLRLDGLKSLFPAQ